jgi:hypothetical protein
VTIIQSPVNSPVMRGFESQIARAVEGGEQVELTVQPIYRGSELVPRAITMTAHGADGFDLEVTVLNQAP